MSAILKFDFQKREQLRFSEVNYLNNTKKDPILPVATTFSVKQGETRTKPWTHSTPFNAYSNKQFKGQSKRSWLGNDPYMIETSVLKIELNFQTHFHQILYVYYTLTTIFLD